MIHTRRMGPNFYFLPGFHMFTLNPNRILIGVICLFHFFLNQWYLGMYNWMQPLSDNKSKSLSKIHIKCNIIKMLLIWFWSTQIICFIWKSASLNMVFLWIDFSERSTQYIFFSSHYIRKESMIKWLCKPQDL